MLKFQISCGFSFSFSHIKLGMLPFCVHVPSKKQACKRTPQSKFKEKLFALMRELITLSLSIKIPQPITYMSCMHDALPCMWSLRLNKVNSEPKYVFKTHAWGFHIRRSDLWARMGSKFCEKFGISYSREIDLSIIILSIFSLHLIILQRFFIVFNLFI